MTSLGQSSPGGGGLARAGDKPQDKVLLCPQQTLATLIEDAIKFLLLKHATNARALLLPQGKEKSIFQSSARISIWRLTLLSDLVTEIDGHCSDCDYVT